MSEDYQTVESLRTVDGDVRPVKNKSFGAREIFIELCINLVWLVLTLVDVVLTVLLFVYNLVCAGKGDKPKDVVIVGASFGGLAAQRELSGRKDVRVTLIDFKDYFEYTPGVLRCFVQPSFLSHLTCPLPTPRNGERLRGAMCGANDQAVVVRDAHGAERNVPYDYLVMAVGSTYADPIKPLQSEPTLADRTAAWTAAAAKLKTANTVIIVGAGPVGIELAGEILTVYPNKHVIFIDMAPKILPGFDEAAYTHVFAWLKKRGAELMLGEAIDEIKTESVLLKSGQEVEADVVYKCVGVMPNTSMLKGGMFEGKGFRGSVDVNDHLQVADHPQVYCVGDMMNHASRELKLGHTAEVNAHLAAHNILADLHGKPLLTYPRGVTGADNTPKIWCLSLGRYDAVLGFNGLILAGWYVAVLKWLLEWSKVAAAGERPVGVLFWKVSDYMSNLLNRTILPPSTKPPKAAGDDDIEKGLKDVVEEVVFPHPALDFLKNPALIDLGMLVMRVVTASLIFHHGLDKLQHVEGFSTNVIAAYFPFLPGPPTFWTYLSAAFEIVGSFCITFGLFVRPAAALLAGTMVNAIAFQLMKFGLQNFPFNPEKGGAYTFEPSMSFLGITAYLLVAGPGRYACSQAPKLDFLKKFGLDLDKFVDLGLLFLRVVTASLIVHHGLDKLQHVEGFSTNVIAAYFPFLPGPPTFWTYLSAAFEIVGSFCITAGIMARPAAALIAGTMVNAIAFHLMKFGAQHFPFNPDAGGAYTYEPSLSFLGVSAYLLVAGPGKLAMRPNGF